MDSNELVLYLNKPLLYDNKKMKSHLKKINKIYMFMLIHLYINIHTLLNIIHIVNSLPIGMNFYKN